MSAFEVDTVMMVGRSVREVLAGHWKDPRLSPILESADIYSAAMNRAFLDRLGINNKFWTGNVQWASDETGNTAPVSHVCNVLQLSDRTCWLLDNSPAKPCLQRGPTNAVPATTDSESAEVIFFLTHGKRLDDTTKPGWGWQHKIPTSKQARIYKSRALANMRSLQKAQANGLPTALEVDQCPDILAQIQEVIEERMQHLLDQGHQTKLSTSLAIS